MTIPTVDEIKTDDSTRPQIIPKVWTDPAVLERAYAYMKKQLEKALPDHIARQAKWLEWDNVYRLIDKFKPTDEGCAVVDPEPQIQVDVMKSNFLESFFSNEPGFEYKGTEESDEEQAELMSAYRADHLRRINLREKFERSIHQWLVYGTAVAKDPWRKEVSRMKVREKNYVFDKVTGEKKLDKNGKPIQKTVIAEKDFPKWDDTDWEYVSLYDFIPVGRGSDIQELEGVIHRSPVTWNHLKKNERKTSKVSDSEIVKGVYYNLENVVPNSQSPFSLCEYWGEIPKYVLTGKDDDQFEMFEGLISCVLHFDESGLLQLKSSHSEKTGEIAELEASQPSGEACVRFQENPFWHGERPFRLCPYTPVDNELYGIGMIEPQVEKWYELNTTIRQLVDNKTLQLLNPTIEDANANVQRNAKLIKFPRIKADDVNGVKPLPINDFSANGWRLIAALKDDMRRASGALEALQGVPMKDERVSATEFQGTFQQAGVRLKSRIRLFDEKMFKKFLERSYQNDMQFAEFERIVRVTGKAGVKFQRVRPEDIWGTFDIITYGPLAFENKVIKANKLTNFFAIAAKAPQFFNIPKLGKKIYVAMDIGTEYEAEEIVQTSDIETPEDVELEITALSLGQPITAKLSQNHALHIQMKVEAAKQLIEAGAMTDEIYTAIETNVNQHIAYQQAQAQQMMGQMKGMGLLGQNGPETPQANAGEAPNPMAQMRESANGLV